MGGQQSVDENNSSIIINHPKFNQAELLRDDEVVRICFNVEHQSDFEEWEKKLHKIASIDDEVLLLPKTYRYTRRAVCSSSGSIYIDFDKYPYLLEDELRNRRKMSKYFEEEELWYLLFSLVTAARNFKAIGLKIGDVRPLNIFINQEGQVKVSNMLSWPRQPSNYIKTAFHNEITYLAPEQVEAIHHNQQENYIDKYKAESFSIGLTLLETGMLREMQSVYPASRNAFDEEKLIYRLRNWWAQTFKLVNESTNQFRIISYSDALKVTIAAMCEIDPAQRLTSEEVENWLKPFANQINDLKPVNKGLPPVRNPGRYRDFLSGKDPTVIYSSSQQKTNQRPQSQNQTSGIRPIFNTYAGMSHQPPDARSRSWADPTLQNLPGANPIYRNTAYQVNRNPQSTQYPKQNIQSISSPPNPQIFQPNRIYDQYNQQKMQSYIFTAESNLHPNLGTHPALNNTSGNRLQSDHLPLVNFTDISSHHPRTEPLVMSNPSSNSYEGFKFTNHQYVTQESNNGHVPKLDGKAESAGLERQPQKLDAQSDILKKIDEQLEASKRNYQY